MINRKEFWGGLIIIIGAVLLLSNMHFLDYSMRRFLRDLWPLIIIAVGVALIFRHVGRSSKTSDDSRQIPPGSPFAGNVSKTFGDIRADMKDRDIDGFTTTTTFGDTTINLAGGKLKGGLNRIRATCTFGDITIIVPGNMEAEAYGTTTFGDIHIFGKTESGVSNTLQEKTAGYDAAVSKVHISAGTTFGDVKVIRA